MNQKPYARKLNRITPKEKKMKSTALGLHAAAETFRADDGAFVQAAHDDFVVVAGFDLEGNLAAFNGDDARSAMNRLTNGRRREVADVNLKADGTFVRIKMWRECMARGAFEKLYDIRGGHDGGHAVSVKFHGMFHVRRDGQLTDFSNLGSRFHWQKKRQS
jgi:hypothetical protein